jgi:hypothetical protein
MHRIDPGERGFKLTAATAQRFAQTGLIGEDLQ